MGILRTFWSCAAVLVIILDFARLRSVHKAFKALNNAAEKVRIPFDEKNTDHWNLQAQWTLQNKVRSPLNRNKAKNVILFLGDGMSITTLAATRAYLGQRHGLTGEELKLSFEVFPFTGLAKTYCVDSNVADSACSGTAYLSGVKANSGTVGVGAGVKRGDCEAQRVGQHSVTGLVDWAQRKGKATGIVTTTRVTHASPAAAYAHSADRLWEADSDMKLGSKCEDIASQLVNSKVGSNIDVIFGGGRQNFVPRSKMDEQGFKGNRRNNTNLIDKWLVQKQARNESACYISDRKNLLTLEESLYTSVLGLFSPDHMPYHLEAGSDVPTLAEMTVKAVQLLARNNKGFFLFVEGGRIDTAHHESKARKALDETAELAKAVEAALRLVDLEETLVVVTSDHSHTMTYSGYSKRGTDILGFTNKMNASDRLPYTTLSYANGPGFNPAQMPFKRQVLRMEDINSLDFAYPSHVPIPRETHGGEDVAVFATGPWAHLFSGSYEQNYIPHAIGYAACIGPGLTSCQ